MRPPCTCCGRSLPYSEKQAIHFDCWNEHHSDPSGKPWPESHACWKETPND